MQREVHCTPLQPMLLGRLQRVAWRHADGEEGVAELLIRDSTQADPGVMGVACQAPAAATGRLVCELQAEGEYERQHTFEKRLAVAQQLKVGRFVLKINGDGPVFASWFGGLAHVSPPVQIVVGAHETP